MVDPNASDIYLLTKGQNGKCFLIGEGIRNTACNNPEAIPYYAGVTIGID